MLSFDPASAEDVIEAELSAAIESVHTAQITYAARDSDFDGHDIHKGEYLALMDGALLGSDADLVDPDILSLVVGLEDRDPQAVHRNLKHLGDELPGPGGRLMLEIVAERKVAQHLEKGAVPGGLADLLDVGGAHALLAGGDALARRRSLPEKIFLHRRHAGVDQQQTVVVLRQQRKALEPGVSLALKKREKLLAQVV